MSLKYEPASEPLHIYMYLMRSQEEVRELIEGGHTEAHAALRVTSTFSGSPCQERESLLNL